MAGGAWAFAALRVLSRPTAGMCHEIFFAQDIFLFFQDIFCDTASLSALLSRFCHAGVSAWLPRRLRATPGQGNAAGAVKEGFQFSVFGFRATEKAFSVSAVSLNCASASFSSSSWSPSITLSIVLVFLRGGDGRVRFRAGEQSLVHQGLVQLGDEVGSRGQEAVPGDELGA